MNDSSEIKRYNHSSLASESPVDKRLSSMPPDQIDSQNLSYSGKNVK